ncbi:MAG: hypothetical protein RR232_07065 [Clostridia bacterium]
MAKNQYTVPKKSVWYVFKTLLIILVVAGIGVGAFTMAMYVSNMYILVTEGMHLRAECILQDGSVLEMTEYFTQHFVDKDAALKDSKYDAFTITDFTYNVDIEGISVMPWGNTAGFRVMEKVTGIAATVNEGSGNPDAKLPEWKTTRYDIVFKRIDSRWYIDELKLIDENPTPRPKGTPDLSLLQENG